MKVIVSYLDKREEHTIKSVKGQDFLFEAAKQELMGLGLNKPREVSVIMRCHRKGFPKKAMFFNTYFVLLAVEMTEEAERLRTRFKTQFGIDVAEEPVQALV